MTAATVTHRDVSEAQTRHAAAWERCCEALEAELDRQRRVLELCKEQGRAARARDIESLESATRELVGLMERVVQAEHARHAAVRAVVEAYGLDEASQNLSGLVGLAPAPWHDRLKQCQREFKTVVRSTQRVVGANRRYLRHGARATDRLLAELFGRHDQAGAYTRDGAEQAKAPSEAALLNTAG